MVPPRIFGVIVLLSLFDVISSICTKKQSGYREEYKDCSGGWCQWRSRWTGADVYSCLDSNIDEIYQDLESNDIPEKKIFIRLSNIPLLEPSSYSWNQITEIYFDNTNTSQIVPGFFNKFEKLQLLEITNNHLQEIIDGVFSPLSALSKLNLSSNLIKGLTQHSFSGLLKLKFLDLSNNKISTIPAQILSYQKELENVNLSQNLLQRVDNAFVGQNSLKTLNLSKNKLINFDFLQIKENGLTHLDLSENLIKNLTETATVVNLNVSHNGVKFLPANLCAAEIRILDLSYNNISEISPYPLQNATSLEHLYLSHNKLTNISAWALTEAKNLQYLDLSVNSLSKIPFALFINLQNLTYLDMSENHMTIDFRVFSFLTSLEVLKLQKNKITSFDPGVAISRFKKLTFLSLGDDSLKCTELANTIHLLHLNNIDIAKGTNENASNIIGISCIDDTDLKEDIITVNRTGSESSEIGYKELQNFLNNDFKNTSFYKFFENFGQHLLVSNNTNVTKDVGDNAFIQYLNENFTKTEFYKYMENVRARETNSIDLYSNLTSVLNYLAKKNKSISSTQQSVNLLENDIGMEHSDSSQTIKTQNSDLAQSKPEYQAIMRQIPENKPYPVTSLVLSNVLQALIFVGILGLLYFHYLNLKRVRTATHEQVQLM